MDVENSLSKNRLNGEDVPTDLRTLIQNNEELFQRTGIRIVMDGNWAPWLDYSYLREEELKNPDIAANLKAIEEVASYIAFFAEEEDRQFVGFWRSPKHRKINECNIVLHNNEGRFEMVNGSSFSEYLLSRTYQEEDFQNLKDWLNSLGVSINAASIDELLKPNEELDPNKLHDQLYSKYLQEVT